MAGLRMLYLYLRFCAARLGTGQAVIPARDLLSISRDPSLDAESPCSTQTIVIRGR
jgi:hypothetical protein